MLIMSMHCIHLKVMLIHIILIKFIQIVMIRSVIITKLNFILVFYWWLSNFIIQSLNIIHVNFISCWFIILSIILWLLSTLRLIFWWNWRFTFCDVLWFFPTFSSLFLLHFLNIILIYLKSIDCKLRFRNFNGYLSYFQYFLSFFYLFFVGFRENLCSTHLFFF